MSRLGYLWRYLKTRPIRLVAGVSCVLGSVTVGMITPFLVGGAVDEFRVGPTSQVLLNYGGLLILVALVRGLFTFSQRIILVTLSRDVEQELRDEYFRHLETLPLQFFHSQSTGDLMARATSDLQAVRMLCGPAIMYSVNTLFAGLGALYFMIGIHPRLSLWALAPMPLVALVTQVFGQRIHSAFEGVQVQFAALSSRVQENLSGLRVVRAYSREDREREVFSDLNDDLVEKNRRLILWTSAFHPLLQGLVGLGFVVALGYGGMLVIDGEISIGQFVTFNFFLTKLVWPMIAIGWVINLTQRGLASLTRIREILDTEPTIAEPVDGVWVEPVLGAIRFDGLDFSYGSDETLALSGIDLEIEAGRTLAVVGRTGSGKSTLISLLPRLIDPPAEALFIDGVDVRRWALSALRGAIAMVPQETFLFSVTVRENIRFGRPLASDSEVLRAAELAGLDSDLASFPRGIDTLVGERGITLSGGQKQRVALARAILCDSPILLLDDCLSAVDTHTEERILNNLRTVFPGRTVILVSHRVSAVREADLIIVLDEGCIVEQGTHEELVKQRGLYADLDQRQRLEEELAAID